MGTISEVSSATAHAAAGGTGLPADGPTEIRDDGVTSVGILPSVSRVRHGPADGRIPAGTAGDSFGRLQHLPELLLQFADLVAEPGGHLELQLGGRKIGRASCRERGWR